MENILVTHALTKVYGRIKAVDGVDMHVKKGEIYGFIGRNGSGKTTSMRMITGMAAPTAGKVEISARVGALIESPGAYAAMTAMDNMRMKCLACGVSARRGRELLEKTGLGDAMRRRVSGFSMGMRQRLGIALALCGDPELLVLDEPMNGLDPQGMVQLRALLEELKAGGMSVLISSHLLSELSRTADSFGILHHGRLVEEFTREELRQRCEERLCLTTPEAEKALHVLADHFVGEIQQTGTGSIEVIRCTMAPADVNRLLVLADVPVCSIGVSVQTVEDYYFALTKEERHG